MAGHLLRTMVQNRLNSGLQSQSRHSGTNLPSMSASVIRDMYKELFSIDRLLGAKGFNRIHRCRAARGQDARRHGRQPQHY
jgi:hypothetical protein